MKKIKHLIFAIILILILFPTCVQAATDAEISSALNWFINGMEKWNLKSSSEFEGKESGLEQTIVTDLMYYDNFRCGSNPVFSRSSFVDYIYKNVFGFNMTNGNEKYKDGDFAEGRINNPNFSPPDEGKLKDLKNDVAVGDIVYYDEYIMICTKPNELKYFSQGNVASIEKSKLSKKCKVYHLLNKDGLTIKTKEVPKVTNTTVESEYKKLNLTAKLVSDGDKYDVEFIKSQRDICKAIKVGYYSQFGKEIDLGVLATVVYGNGTPISTTYENYIKYFEIDDEDCYEKDKIKLEDYRNEGYASEYVSYFKSSGDKSLKLKLEFEDDQEPFMTQIIEITNGKQDSDGEIKAFTDGIIADAKLSEFTGVELEYDDNTKAILYELKVTNGTSATIARENGKFKENRHGEILFTVNKSGNYIVKYSDTEEIVNNICVAVWNPNSYDPDYTGTIGPDWQREFTKSGKNN